MFRGTAQAGWAHATPLPGRRTFADPQSQFLCLGYCEQTRKLNSLHWSSCVYVTARRSRFAWTAFVVVGVHCWPTLRHLWWHVHRDMRSAINNTRNACAITLAREAVEVRQFPAIITPSACRKSEPTETLLGYTAGQSAMTPKSIATVTFAVAQSVIVMCSFASWRRNHYGWQTLALEKYSHEIAL